MFVPPLPPVNVTFSYVSIHTLQYAAGLVNPNPSVPHTRNVRSINRPGIFTTFYNTVLHWTLVDKAGIPGFGGPVNLNLGPGNAI
jgi:hypothetical protein